MSIKINTKRLVLKKIEPKDINELISNLNNWDIVKWLSNVPYPYTNTDASNWINKSKKEELSLNIYYKNTLIGGITIDKRNNDNNDVLGYWIGKEYWGFGFATEACYSIISYFFSNTLELKIYASHILGNEKSKKILTNLGFKKINTGYAYSISRQEQIQDINYELIKS